MEFWLPKAYHSGEDTSWVPHASRRTSPMAEVAALEAAVAQMNEAVRTASAPTPLGLPEANVRQLSSNRRQQSSRQSRSAAVRISDTHGTSTDGDNGAEEVSDEAAFDFADDYIPRESDEFEGAGQSLDFSDERWLDDSAETSGQRSARDSGL